MTIAFIKDTNIQAIGQYYLVQIQLSVFYVEIMFNLYATRVSNKYKGLHMEFHSHPKVNTCEKIECMYNIHKRMLPQLYKGIIFFFKSKP